MINGWSKGLLFVGRYKNGLPHGHGWAFPPDMEQNDTGGLYVKFLNNGDVDKNRMVYVWPDFKHAAVGVYNDRDGVLENATEFRITKYGDKGCIRHIKIPKKVEMAKGTKRISLPAKIMSLGGRVHVMTSRVLMFNRVAKVGSQALIKLMSELSKKNHFKVR